MSRDSSDGKPFYCAVCGAGYGEYMGCEQVDCRLETEAEARSRAERQAQDKEKSE